MMNIVIASSNPGKIEEFKYLFAAFDGIEIVSARDLLGPDWHPDESGTTLEENAYLKVITVYEKCLLPTIADDTGLEVYALGGRPGVYSARFAGDTATAAMNNALLLQLLEGITDRRAQFRTVLCYQDHLRTIFAEGICVGTIAHTPEGDKGFGYDPLFIPEGSTRTFAQMSCAEKNSISHRNRAFQKLYAQLTELWA